MKGVFRDLGNTLRLISESDRGSMNSEERILNRYKAADSFSHPIPDLIFSQSD